jgi:hypothetical protein
MHVPGQNAKNGMSDFSPSEYSALLNRKIAALKELENKNYLAFSEAHADHMQAIFGGMEGTKYSTRPTLSGSNVLGKINRFGTTNFSFILETASAKYFGSKKKVAEQKWVRKLTPKGPRNLIVIEGGYAEIRRAEGRQTAKVDLSRTGIMELDLSASLVQTDKGAQAGFNREENIPKWEGAVNRYGNKLEVPKDVLEKLTENLSRTFVEFLTITQ